jgi:hypothetical protein
MNALFFVPILLILVAPFVGAAVWVGCATFKLLDDSFGRWIWI